MATTVLGHRSPPDVVVHHQQVRPREVPGLDLEASADVELR